MTPPPVDQCAFISHTMQAIDGRRSENLKSGKGNTEKRSMVKSLIQDQVDLSDDVHLATSKVRTVGSMTTKEM